MFSLTALENCLIKSTEEARELHIPEAVPVITGPPTPLEFIRKYVSCNTPFIIKGGASRWPAFKKWSIQYLRKQLSNKLVTVAVTPNGLADAVNDGMFMLPEEREMRFSDFLDNLEGGNGDIFYIQKQNSNLTLDFQELLGDIDSHVPWATEAFQAKPDAVNFWMGPAQAVTSMHKDHYENLYAVISGEKQFILHPPFDRPFIPHHNYLQARYQKIDGIWRIEKLSNLESIPWISIDPLNPDYKQYPMYKHAKMIKCKVQAGDLFYLPALWFHHVSQAPGTIAVNYWYDMEFDIKYSNFQTLDRLSRMLGR